MPSTAAPLLYRCSKESDGDDDDDDGGETDDVSVRGFIISRDGENDANVIDC